MQLLTKKSSTEFPSHFELNVTNIVNKQIIADESNNFFVNVGPNLAKNIPAVITLHLFMITWVNKISIQCLSTP